MTGLYTDLKNDLNLLYARANGNFTKQLDRRIQLYEYALTRIKYELIKEGYKIYIKF